MLDNATYKMHADALEGGVFFRNELAEPAHVQKYFPPRPLQKNYDREPHRSFPVTSDVINRLASLLHDGMSVTCDNTAVGVVMEEMLERNNWAELSRQLLTQPLAVGNFLAVLNAGWNGVRIEMWSGEYAFSTSGAVGYEYELNKNGEMVPILKKPAQNADIRVVLITDYFFGDMAHGLGFTPAVMFNGVDWDKELRYAYPFFQRFRTQLLDYNRIYSYCLKAMTILQGKWTANKSAQDPSVNFEVDVDEIAYIGEGGELKQADRKLDLTHEYATLDRLRAHISASAQVPDFMTGLRDVGKVESGVALQIVSGPLLELVNRIKFSYTRCALKLIERATAVEFALRGQTMPKCAFEMTLNDNILPVDKQAELGNLSLGVEKGFVTADEARPRYLQLMGMEELLDNNGASQVA